MTTRRPSANLTKIMKSIGEDELRRTRDRMLVAVKIADVLETRNITQKKFAEMMGKSESEISEWLSGDRNFTIDTLSDIQKCLGVNLLNVSSMASVSVPESELRLKTAKTRKPAVYDMSDVTTSAASAGWQTALNLVLSLVM